MKQETLDEIIERLAQDCIEECSKRKSGGSADTEYIKIEKYERTTINKEDDNR